MLMIYDVENAPTFEMSKLYRSKGIFYTALNGKFSSGIEGALASTLNHDFNWKQLSETLLCIFYLMFSKFIWVTLIQKQQKYK